ncbi:hypothetical protein A9Z50_14795 [Aeromonas hydrophila]|nr:hypothetical protein [Aeromonas hydrophila]
MSKRFLNKIYGICFFVIGKFIPAFSFRIVRKSKFNIGGGRCIINNSVVKKLAIMLVKITILLNLETIIIPVI